MATSQEISAQDLENKANRRGGPESKPSLRQEQPQKDTASETVDEVSCPESKPPLRQEQPQKYTASETVDEVSCPESKPSLRQEQPQKYTASETVDEVSCQIGNLEIAAKCDPQSCSNIQRVFSDIAETISENESVQKDELISKKSSTLCDQITDESSLSRTSVCKDLQKTQCRLEFLPVEKFNAIQIPERHRNEDIFKFVKLYAKLTVKISLRNGKTGSGWIGNVTKMSDEKCPCRACQQLFPAKTQWWEIDIFVAPHLVLDQSEASDATLRLFYDREYSPLIHLRDADLIQLKHETWLTCTTHDKDLGSELFDLRTHFYPLWSTLEVKHKDDSDSERMTFMVVHPDESPKHIVFGQWVPYEQKVEGVPKQGIVTSEITGCAGAPVCTVGQSYFEPSKHIFYPARSSYG